MGLTEFYGYLLTIKDSYEWYLRDDALFNQRMIRARRRYTRCEKWKHKWLKAEPAFRWSYCPIEMVYLAVTGASVTHKQPWAMIDKLGMSPYLCNLIVDAADNRKSYLPEDQYLVAQIRKQMMEILGL